MNAPRLHWLIYALTLATLSAALFADLRHHDWAFDDEDFVANARLAQDHFLHIFAPDKPFAARPTVHLYFWAVHPLFGANPAPYHLANVGLHALVALLLALLIHALSRRFVLAAVAGLLFLTTAIHLRAVYWIAGVSHLLGAGLGLAAVLAFVSYLDTGRAPYRYLSLLLFALAALAHESAAIFILLFALALYYRLSGPIQRSHSSADPGFPPASGDADSQSRPAPGGAASQPLPVPGGAVSQPSPPGAQPSSPGAQPRWFSFSFIRQVMTLPARAPVRWRSALALLAPHLAVLPAVWLISRYLYATPLTQADDFRFGLHALTNLPWQLFRLFAGYHWEVWLLAWPREAEIGAGLIIALILLGAAYRFPALRPAVAWTLGACLPFVFWTEGPKFWRYYYLPATGSSLLIAAALCALGQLAARLSRQNYLSNLLPFTLTAALIAANAGTLARLQCVQHDFSGHYFEKNKRNFSRAAAQYERALTLSPNHPWAYRWRYNRAVCWNALGRTEEARTDLLELARQHPDYDSPHILLLQLYAQSRGYPPNKIGAQFPATLADTLRADIRAAFQQDQTLQAESLARLYLHHAPGDPQVTPLLIDLFARQHRFAEALQLYEELAAQNPDDPHLLSDMGGLCIHLGDLTRAEQLLTRAAALAPDQPWPHYNLGLLYWNQERWTLCVSEWEQTLRLGFDHRFADQVIAKRLPIARQRAAGR